MANNIFRFPGGSRGGPARRLVPSRLRDARLAQRLNQSELAAAVNVSRQAISAFEQGEKSPEAETLARIANVLDQPIAFFATEDRPVFGDSSTRFYRAFGPDTKRRNLMCEVLGKWFAQTTKYFDNLVNLPKVDVPSGMPFSTNGRYSEEEIEFAAEECRRRWGLGLGPISNVVGLLENKGVSICRYEVPQEKIEAFSFWNGPRPFLFLASDKGSAARARYDAAHELGHLVLHRWVGSEELEDSKALKEIEREANRFAGAFLLPRKSFPNEVYTTRLDAFIELKRRWKVAIQAMVYRCKDLGIFDEYQITNLYIQISRRKWKTKEPLDGEDGLPLEEPRLLKHAAELVLRGSKKIADEIRAELGVGNTFIEAFCGVSASAFDQSRTAEFSPSLK
jgi:Zn-dependent peptidase ImmA (M78 family)/transcriptional regulator with XRE-family HTH domain